VTIILGGDSLNKTFSLKEPDARNLFFSKDFNFFKAAAMSGATLSMVWSLLMNMGLGHMEFKVGLS
jgi:hypothetical protein